MLLEFIVQAALLYMLNSNYFILDGTNVIRFVPFEVVYFSKWTE